MVDKVLYGTNNAETIYGWNQFSELIVAYGGDDTVYGQGGDDVLEGGAGADYLDGGAGVDMASYLYAPGAVIVSLATGQGFGSDAEDDTLVNIEDLEGSYHADVLVGDNGSNLLRGYWGDDLLKGGGGNDSLLGEVGSDILQGGGGADVLNGGPGADTAAYNESNTSVFVSLRSNIGSGGTAQGDTFSSIENLTGSNYDDALWGDDGVNAIMGGSGNDSLKGFAGADTLNGGAGSDTATYDGSNEGVVVFLSTNSAWDGDAEGDTFVSIENLTGSDHADLLGGDEAANVLRGMAGHDSLKGYGGTDALWGGAGNDSLDGGAGADTMIGGIGNDAYTVDNANDTVTEFGGQGLDVVSTSVSWVMTAGADVETLRTTDATATAAINLVGNSSGNVVQGNNGNNIINGGDGNDELTGYGGQDSFLFDTDLSPAFNVDEITDFNVADDTIRLDDDVFSSDLLANNSVAGSQFVIGAAALDAGHRVIYNSVTGAVYYDSDGTGAVAQIQFAQLSPGLALTHFDFLVVA